MDIKLNKAERIVVMDTYGKIQQLQNSFQEILKDIVLSREKEIPENAEVELSEDFNMLTLSEPKSNEPAEE